MAKGPRLKIVSLAGGTGRYFILKDLKNVAEITALYNITDSGGSSRLLRVEHGVLPPGDGTKALAALVTAEDDEKFLLDRFSEGRVTGHRIGNLMYEAATRKFGGDLEGILYLQKLFKPKGRVLPVSLARGVDLIVKLEDGTTIQGEHEIDTRGGGSPIIDAWLSSEAVVLPEAKEAIEEADIILFGPGDLWTSIVPHLLVKGLPEAIRNSSARKMMICNLVTKPGETDGYTTSRYAQIVTKFLGCQLDDFIVNSNHVQSDVKDAYQQENKQAVIVDETAAFAKNTYEYALASTVQTGEINPLRHDPQLTTKAILEVFAKTKIVGEILPAVPDLLEHQPGTL